jgi:hypothetical protein
MAIPLPKQGDLFEAHPKAFDIWADRLLTAFADGGASSGVLPPAEEAIAAVPGDAVLLLLAATAALLDGRPTRALVLLKRFSKRAEAPAAHLLRVLALNGVNRRAARALLEQHRLTRWPGGVCPRCRRAAAKPAPSP